MTDKTICIWGDSITHGYNDSEKGGWAERLALDLDFRTSTTVYNLGIPGDTSEDLLKRFEVEAAAREPNIIIFAIGTNDSYFLVKENRVQVSPEGFISNLKELMNKAKKYTDNITFVSAVPVDENRTKPIPWNTNVVYTNNSLVKYNKIVETVCQEHKLKFVDLYSKFLATDYIKLCSDGVHPTSEGHELIYKLVKDSLDL